MTPWGYELRVSGKSEKVSLYAGIPFKKMTIITLMIWCIGWNDGSQRDYGGA